MAITPKGTVNFMDNCPAAAYPTNLILYVPGTTSSYGSGTVQLDTSSQTVSRPENPLNSISTDYL